MSHPLEAVVVGHMKPCPNESNQKITLKRC